MREFQQQAAKLAAQMLRGWVGEERSAEATGRVAAALAASAASARDPRDFFACTPTSIATCIALASLTGIMPGVGSTALAYAIPQRPRKDEPPQLQYMLSHRGLNALARRCGQTMIAVPIGIHDEIEADANGDVEIISRDLIHPPTTWDELVGVLIVVRELRAGFVLHKGFMPRILIEARRAMSRSWNGGEGTYSPWMTWPIEMAIKTAMHYAISRGWCVIDDSTALAAVGEEARQDVAQAKVIETPNAAQAITLMESADFDPTLDLPPDMLAAPSEAGTTDSGTLFE